ncbi:MAG: valine--tRNA ligase [Candidatus Woesearchaeota archaeon]
MEIPKKYDPSVEEAKIRQRWDEQKPFAFDPNTTKQLFSIDTPPPTMSGKMHIGHACSFSQQDIIARFKRMMGFAVFYPFGTDDNGLPTEKLVQKEKNVLATKMDRDEFIHICLDFLQTERPKFVQDWKNIGMSCDFDNPYSTIDDHSRKIAQKTFLKLLASGRAQRKEAPVIWDTLFQSAIAQAELEDVEKTTWFNDIVFTTEDGKELLIATTRPELLGACVAIFAHPEDERYTSLFGKFAYSPLYKQKVPILADEKADPQKGTGIVMCCTFGDQTDIEWFKKHNLPLRLVITPDGRMSEAAGEYAGLKIEAAREKIIDDLKAANLLRSQKQITHTVNVGERSGRPVEILNSKQWYVTYLDKREEMLTWSRKLEWKPEFMKHRLDNWIKGLNWDWSISRQRHFGVPIPVWYDASGKMYLPDESQLPVDPLKDRPNCAPEGVELIGEKDVFDTWFTSASTPYLAAEKYEGTPIFDKLIPMDIRPQAHDIISFWLFYTLTKTQLLEQKMPWKQALISGWILDPKGKKMAKSKGNVVSPQKIMEKYSADAIRYWASSIKLGEDSAFQEKELITATKLINKIWNASKFCHMHLAEYTAQKPQTLEALDEWILGLLSQTIEESQKSFDAYEYHRAKTIIENFFWNFCDNYLEIVKDRLYKPEVYGIEAKQSGQYTIAIVLRAVLKMFAPILCYVTDAVWSYMFEEKTSIHAQSWPILEADTTQAATLYQPVVDVIGAVRRFKSEKNISLKTEIALLTIEADKATQELILKTKQDILATTKAKHIVFGAANDLEVGAIRVGVEFEQSSNG